MSGVAQEVLRKGEIDIRKKFPSVRTNMLARDLDTDEWVVVTTIQANDRKYYEVADPLKGWPSEALIAQLMLLEATS